MPTITLEHVKAEQTKLARMIADLEAAQRGAPVAYVIDEAEIALAPGERYAGIVLDADGNFSHHLVLVPGQNDGVTWEQAKAWAAEIGGELPTRQEQALLYANLKRKFEAAWYWSSEQYESDGSSAWGQLFHHGVQNYYHKSYEGRARAVRRFSNVLRRRGKAVRADLAKVYP